MRRRAEPGSLRPGPAILSSCPVASLAPSWCPESRELLGRRCAVRLYLSPWVFFFLPNFCGFQPTCLKRRLTSRFVSVSTLTAATNSTLTRLRLNRLF